MESYGLRLEDQLYKKRIGAPVLMDVIFGIRRHFMQTNYFLGLWEHWIIKMGIGDIVIPELFRLW